MGTPLLKVEWELAKFPDSWVLNTPECRPRGPYKDYLAAKKAATVSTTLAAPGARPNVWEEEPVKKKLEQLQQLEQLLTQSPRKMMETSLDYALKKAHYAAQDALSPLNFNAKTFKPASKKFCMALTEVAALNQQQPGQKKVLRGRPALLWEMASYDDAFSFFYEMEWPLEVHCLLKAVWTAGQGATQVHTHAEINERMPLRCAGMFID